MKPSISSEPKSDVDIPAAEAKPELIKGTVKSTRVDTLKGYTDIVFESGRQDSQDIRVKNNAGFLLGKLCVLDVENGGIWPAAEPEYVFAVYTAQPRQTSILVDCPKCGVAVTSTHLRKHLKNKHGMTNSHLKNYHGLTNHPVKTK